MLGNKDGRYRMTLKYPASWWGNQWREALPAGNGSIGAAVYGGVTKEIILLNHAELWNGVKRDSLPDVSYTLPKVRKLISEEKYTEADWLLANTLKQAGYASTAGTMLPFADFRIDMPCINGFKNYRRCLDMETGEVSVYWKDGMTSYKRSLFVSRNDDVIVYEIKTDGEAINAQFSINMHDEADSRNNLKNQGIVQSMDTKLQGDKILYAVQNDDGTDFGAVMKIITSGGEFKEHNCKLSVNKSQNVLVLIKLFVKGERQREWKKLTGELDDICSNYSRLFESHSKIHTSLFNSALIEISDKACNKSNEELLLDAYEGEPDNSFTEKMWAFGRYLLISSTRREGLPCALYGLWCGDYNPSWCQHVTNENLELIHMHAAVGGLSELMLSLFNYFDGLMGDFRENAIKLFGCRGINIHGYISPNIGVASVLVPVILNWTGAAGWIAKFYFDYYLYTGDLEFLSKRALPFMRDTAHFYEDFFVLGKDGYLISYPSVSPENSPGRFWDNDDAMTHPMATTINATMDFAIAKELMNNLIYSCKLTETYMDELPRWEDLLQNIPPYQITEEGVLKEWMHPNFDEHYNHRHMTHVYPIFPGHEASKELTPELFEALVKAVKKRLVVGVSDQSGWSLSHMACTYARMEDGDSALECLELLSRSCVMNNFFSTHNDWRNMGISVDYKEAPFQIDANMGWTNAVQEMLLYVSHEIIKILPALPSKWLKGEVKDFRFCTGRISFSWDIRNRKFCAKLYAERGTKVMLKLPKEFSPYQFKCDDNLVFPKINENNCVDLIIESGKQLYVEVVKHIF